MTPRLILTPLILGAVLLGAGPAWSQADPLTDPLPRALGERADRRLDRVEQTLREMRAILFQGRDTGRAVVVQPVETQGQVEALTAKVSDLESTLRLVNSQLDSLTADIGAARRDQTATATTARDQAAANAALTARIDALEKRLNEAAAQQAAVPASYDSAMQLYVDGQHRAAAAAFQTYLDANPDAAEAPEARYYLGEALYRQANYNDAAIAYLASIRGWPAKAWAPDATVKLAQSLIEIRKTTEACGILTDFAARYPRATAAVKANAATARTRARCG